MENKLAVAVAMAVILLIAGSISYHFIERWSYIDSIYFTAVTLTTIGYGDLTPKTDLGKIFTVFFIFAGVGIFLLAISTIAEFAMKKRAAEFEKGLETFKQSIEVVKKTPMGAGLERHTRTLKKMIE